MPSLNLDYDAETAEPSAPRDVIPAGEYLAQMVASEVIGNDDGSPRYLKTEWDVMEPGYEGRKLWVNLNLWHANDTPRTIAQADLSAMCRSVGAVGVRDSEALHFKPMVLTVKVRPEGPDKKDPSIIRAAQNEVRGYKAREGNPPPAARPGAATPPPRAAAPPARSAPPAASAAKPGGAAAGKMPWDRT